MVPPDICSKWHVTICKRKKDGYWRASWRSDWRALETEALTVQFGVDTVQNEKSRVWRYLQKRSELLTPSKFFDTIWKRSPEPLGQHEDNIWCRTLKKSWLKGVWAPAARALFRSCDLRCDRGSRGGAPGVPVREAGDGPRSTESRPCRDHRPRSQGARQARANGGQPESGRRGG